MCVEFLRSLEIQTERILTSDVLGREDFMGQLRIAARAWQAYQDLRRVYDGHKRWSWSRSNTATAEEELRQRRESLCKAFDELASLSLTTT